MTNFGRANGLKVITLIAFIGSAFLLYEWIKSRSPCKTTKIEEFVNIDEKKFKEEDYAQKFLSKIDSRDHPNCKMIRQKYPLVEKRDGDMDIAFTIVVHKDSWQITRLLRMIHRINNYYCIHPDARSSVSFLNALQGAATCFGTNVELVPPEKRIAVTWGDETVLKPQLVCGEQALRRHSTWRYLINTVGQEFPLRTNLELIAALKALNGSNLIEGDSIEPFKHRVNGTVLPLKVICPSCFPQIYLLIN